MNFGGLRRTWHQDGAIKMASVGLVRLWNCALEASSVVAGKADSWMTVLSTGGADEGGAFMPLLLFHLSSLPFLFWIWRKCFFKVTRPFFTAPLQAYLSLARVSLEFVSMFRDFRSRLQMSLNRSWSLPTGRSSFHHFTIQNILWDSALLHSIFTNMSQSSQASLFQERVHAWQIWRFNISGVSENPLGPAF